MANRNPWQARMKRWAKLWPRPIAELQAQAYGVLMMAYEGVAVEDAEQRRKNILAYFQGLTAFNRLQETVNLDARLTALEQRLHHEDSHPNGTKL
jgi:hypothetical protein